MTNKEKLNEIVNFLNKEGIDFILRPENVRMKSNLYIPKWKIGVKLEDEDNERYYQAHKRFISTIFIRESEAVGFILEKLQNVIVQKMMAAQRNLLRKSCKSS